MGGGGIYQLEEEGFKILTGRMIMRPVNLSKSVNVVSYFYKFNTLEDLYCT